MKIEILKVKIDNLSKNEAISAIVKRISEKTKTLIVTPNPELVVIAQKDPRLLEILNSADFSFPDGHGLICASKILGNNSKLKERIPGTDLAEELLRIGSRNNWKIGIVGARRGDIQEIETLIKNLKLKIKNLKIEALELSDKSNDRNFDLIFACQANGTRERWMADNKKKVNGTVFIGIGGALDFIAGVTKRAPITMQKLGLEWFWRLLIKPKTHVKRVWNAVFVFLWLVVREKAWSVKQSDSQVVK